MAGVDRDDAILNVVLINNEGQYSLWPLKKDIPNGWVSTGKEGRRDECVEYIEDSWTDMRPRSLSAAMDGLPREQ